MSLANGRKPSQQRERRLVLDYVMTKYPDAIKFFNYRVGGVPSSLHRNKDVMENPSLAIPWARYVDAIVVLPEKLILIEAKLPAKLEAVAQLMMYKQLVPLTPELANYRSLPIQLLLVTARPDPQLIGFANQQGIDVDIFQPDYALEYLAHLLGGPVS